MIEWLRGGRDKSKREIKKKESNEAEGQDCEGVYWLACLGFLSLIIL